MKAIVAAGLCLALVQGSGSGPGVVSTGNANRDASLWGMSPKATSAENGNGLRKIFASSIPVTVVMPPGTYSLPCASDFVAASSVSLIGAGADRTVLRLDSHCGLDHPLMSWISRSNVRLSGFTLDLNNSRFIGRQDVLQFDAFKGNASGLRIDHIAILRGSSPSLQIAVAASGGAIYSNVAIDHNHLQMVPSTAQNQCIALSTVNGLGAIPSAQISNNICRGSGIQADGEGTLISANDVSDYEFGTGIFTAFVSPIRVTNASWSAGIATLHYAHLPNSFRVGEVIHVWGTNSAGSSGTFKVKLTSPTSVSYVAARVPDPRAVVFVAPEPSSRNCIIRDNAMHDTRQALDVNRTAPGGLENNCVNSRVTNNNAENLGGAGYVNFASGSTYLGNRASNVGFLQSGSAGGEGDASAFMVSDNGSGMPWYSSRNLTFEKNSSSLREGRPRYGYFEEAAHVFKVTFRGNEFHGTERAIIERGASVH